MSNLVTTVITVCDRLDYLDSQIAAIENQSIKSNIFIHWNNPAPYTLQYPAFVYHNTEKHLSLYSRFYNSINNRTPYTFIIDDDMLPGTEYLSKCIEFSKQLNDKVLIGGLGMNLVDGESRYKVKSRIGAHYDIFPFKPTKVDMVGQSYFMHSDVISHYTHTPPLHEYGEDIHLAFCMYSNKIPIYVLDIDREDTKTYPDTTFGKRGVDINAQWRHPRHQVLRDYLVKSFIDKGWSFPKINSLI